MRQLEVAVGDVIVTDDGLAAAVQRQRGEPPDIAGTVQGLDSVAAAAGGIATSHQLEVDVGDVIVTDDGVATTVQRQRGVPPDISGTVHSLDGVAAAAGGIATGHQLEVAVAAVIVTDDGVATTVQRQRGVLPDISGTVHSLDGVATGAGGIAAVHQLEVAVEAVIVTDDRVATTVQRQRGVLPDISGTVHGGGLPDQCGVERLGHAQAQREQPEQGQLKPPAPRLGAPCEK